MQESPQNGTEFATIIPAENFARRPDVCDIQLGTADSDTHKDQNRVLNFVNLPLLLFAVGLVWEPVRAMDACYSLPSSA